MTATQIVTFRQQLEARQTEVTDRIQRVRDRLAISERGDTLDRVRIINEREFAVRDLAVEVRLLKDVQEALREIRAGTFGRCAGCDREIPLRRLQAVPWSPYCVECQELAETRGCPQADSEQQSYAQAG